MTAALMRCPATAGEACRRAPCVNSAASASFKGVRLHDKLMESERTEFSSDDTIFTRAWFHGGRELRSKGAKFHGYQVILSKSAAGRAMCSSTRREAAQNRQLSPPAFSLRTGRQMLRIPTANEF